MMRSFWWSHFLVKLLPAAGQKKAAWQALCACPWQGVNGLNFLRLSLLFGMRYAEAGRRDQVFAFVAIDGVEGEGVPGIWHEDESLPEVVGFSLVGGEVGHGEGAGAIFEPRLPVDTEMVFAGSDREEEIRAALVGSDPRSVQSCLGQRTTRAMNLVDVLHYIHQCLARLGLGRGMVGRVLFGVKLYVLGAACGFGGCDEGLVLQRGLGESGSGKKTQNKSGFHDVPPDASQPLFRMRCARLVRGDQKLSFIRIDRFEIQIHVGRVAPIGGVGNALAEVVHLARFSIEPGERSEFRKALPTRLPAGAQVVLSRFDGEGEI